MSKTDNPQRELDFNPPKPEKRIVVFDLETRLSADEVGGWQNTHLMRIAVGVAHDSIDDSYKVFYEEDADGLLALLRSADLVVGFNSAKFDYAVLSGYTDEPLGSLPTFDILQEIYKEHGFRVGLGNLAENTLGVGKSADGMQSLVWFREGKLDLVTDYCKQDVKVTRDIFRFGLENGYLLYGKKNGQKSKLTVNWPAHGGR